MTNRHLIPVTPSVLKWAIRESGYDDEQLAHEVGVPLERLLGWQSGEGQPSKTEFDTVVAKLKRPTALFFLPKPPSSHTPAVKFRRPHGSSRVRPSPEELRALRQVARVQSALAWSIRELGTRREPLPAIRSGTDIEGAASRIRSFLRAANYVSDQVSSDSRLQNEWRTRIEERGTFVFLLPLGRDSVRGFSLYEEDAPLIAVNTAWDYRPRVFSMLHEFAHLVSRTSSACVETFNQRIPDGDDDVERWCEQVASAVLMPWETLQSFLRTDVKLRPRESINSLERLYRIANHFRASARATAIRLISKGLADWALYRQIPQSKEEKRAGGAGGGRTRPEIHEDEYGPRALRVFASAVDDGLITGAEASGYLKISDVELEAWR